MAEIIEIDERPQISKRMTARLSIRFWQLESSAQRCEALGKCHVQWRLDALSRVHINVRASRGREGR
jgi:hypothetical protein